MLSPQKYLEIHIVIQLDIMLWRWQSHVKLIQILSGCCIILCYYSQPSTENKTSMQFIDILIWNVIGHLIKVRV